MVVALSLGVSAGPAFADGLDPVDPSTGTTLSDTTEPVPAEPPAIEPVPAEPAPEPAPVSTEPTQPAEPKPTEPTEPPVETSPDLRITVVFDKASYFADEVVVARVTVLNAGTATATGVRVTSTGNIDSHFWSGFGWPYPTLEPGQTAEGRAGGFATSAEDGVVRLVVTTQSDDQDAEPTDNVVTVDVPLVVVRGNYAGTVYGDNDGSGTMDPGEELAGLAVHVVGGNPNSGLKAVTDPAGRFVFHGLPTGRYSVYFDTTQWWFASLLVTVDEVDDPDVVIRGANWVTGTLSAAMVFTRAAYAEGEIAHLALALTNTGPAIPDVTADCWAAGGSLISAGELGREGGAVIPARGSRTFGISFRVDPPAALVGHLTVECLVGAPPFGNGVTRAVATTRVPGHRAAKVTGQLFRLLPTDNARCPGYPKSRCPTPPPPSEPLTGVKVFLRSQVTGKVVARATTDTRGVFTFYDVPADLYDFGVVGPWTWSTFVVRADDNDTYPNLVYVQDGPWQPDPDPVPPPPAPAPPAQGVNVPATLATTGADLRRLALGGLLALALGIGLTTRTRRPTA